MLPARLPLDHLLPDVTENAVSLAMMGFQASLVTGKNMAWLAKAVRKSLVITLSDELYGPQRASNAAVRAELERLADLAGSTWVQIFERDRALDGALIDSALENRSGRNEPSDYGRLNAALSELDWLTNYLRRTAQGLQSQRGPWRQSEARQQRVDRAQCLAPIYEAAFGQPVSANNWPNGVHQRPSAFMDFYQRMVALAFGERATPDLSGVLKIACQMHRQYPVVFAEEYFDDL